MRTDEYLLRATPHDPPAFADFYRRHERAVVLYFLRRTGSAELAADLTAETFAATLASIKRFDARGEGSGTAWLFGIAHNVLRRSARRKRVEDNARKRLKMPPLALTDELLERIDELADAEKAAALLDQLPAAQREALTARVVDERDYGDIAAELECSEAVVRQRVARGLRTLRTQMEENP
jgi:RNA polymerase sigma-70 factor (ECF subfamily)